MLATVECFHGDRCMHVVGGTHHHCIKLVSHLGVHLAPVCKGSNACEQWRDCLAVVALATKSQHVERSAIDIAECNDLHRLVLRNFGEVTAAHAAATNLGDAELLILPRLAAVQVSHRAERKRRSERGKHK